MCIQIEGDVVDHHEMWLREGIHILIEEDVVDHYEVWLRKGM